MKERILPILICLLLCLSVVFCACGGTNNNEGRDNMLSEEHNQTIQENFPIVDETLLTAEEELEIKKAFQSDILSSLKLAEDEIPLDSISIYNYYGSYDGVKVLIIDSNRLDHTCIYPEYTVGGYVFEGVHQSCFMCYKAGEILWLGNAYENGWLDEDDIKSINEKHRKLYPHYYS